MLGVSKIEESFWYRLQWELFANTIHYLYIFELFLFFFYLSGVLTDKLILIVLLMAIAIAYLLSLRSSSTVKFLANLIPFTATLIFFVVRLNPISSIFAEFLLIFAIYSLANAILQSLMETDSSWQRSVSFILTQLNKFLAVGSILILLQNQFPHEITFSPGFLQINYTSTITNIYLMLNLVAFTLGFFANMVQLIARNTKLVNISRRLKQISSWSLDQQIIEENLLEQEGYLNHELRTIIIGDIRGFSAFSEENDIATVVTILQHLYSIVEKIIARHHGFKPEFIADEFITFFDNNKQAIDCGLELASEINGYLDQYDLGVGMGIDRGPVLEGVIGGGESKKYTVIGRAVNVASRLQGNAKAGEILITSRATHTIHGLNLKEIRNLELKGVNRKMHIYLILSYKEPVVSKNIFRKLFGRVRFRVNKIELK
jgi:class 3 adenylate cyclase